MLFSFRPIREQDGQASGGNDFGSDDWIFTIREKDPKKLQNGEGQSGAADQVRASKIKSYSSSLGTILYDYRCLSQTKDIPKRPYSQSLATVISPALAEVSRLVFPALPSRLT